MSTAGQWKHSLLKPSCKNQLYWITLYKHILFYLTASMCNSLNGSFSTNFLNLLFIFAASSYLLGAHSSPALAAQNFLWTYYRHSYYLAFSYFAQKLLKQRKQLCVASRSHILSSTHAGLQFSVFFSTLLFTYAMRTFQCISIINIMFVINSIQRSVVINFKWMQFRFDLCISYFHFFSQIKKKISFTQI